MARKQRRVAVPRGPAPAATRLTVDASVFVNAFNPHEDGDAASLALLEEAHSLDVPIIVPALLLTEVTSAIARVTGAGGAALDYSLAIAALPHVSIVPVTQALGREAAALAAEHRLRGADAVYVAVSRRYATTLVTCDDEQRQRGAAATPCASPAAALRGLR